MQSRSIPTARKVILYLLYMPKEHYEVLFSGLSRFEQIKKFYNLELSLDLSYYFRIERLYPYAILEDILNFIRSIFTKNDAFSKYGYGDLVLSASSFINLVPGLLRAVLLLFFIFLLLIKPFHAVIMTLWGRIVESDKPIFTMVLGSAAAFAKAFESLLNLKM